MEPAIARVVSSARRGDRSAWCLLGLLTVMFALVGLVLLLLHLGVLG